MKKLFLLFFILVSSNTIKAQACALVTFTYDACGNRVNRSLQVQPCNSNKPGFPDIDSVAKDEIVFSKDVKVYPNPTAESIFMEWQNDSLGVLENVCLIDITGKVIKTVPIPSSDESSRLDLTDQKNGIYTLELKFTGNRKKYYKIIKN